MLKLISLFRDRRIPVEFRNLPQHSIDSSLFDQVEYAKIVEDGYFRCSPAELLQAAAVHFQGRHKSRSIRFLNACLEIWPSLSDGPQAYNSLRLNSSESSEFQAKSSEVIGVGLGLSLCRRLTGIRYQDISTIQSTGKRCDFSFVKNSLDYIIEVRGRKGENQVTSAIKDVFIKKSNYSAAKYGFVSHLPRGGQQSSIVVIDPPSKPQKIEDWEKVSRLLRHYSRASRLAGFWRLSDLLLLRSADLISSQSLKYYNRVPLDFGNILKMGRLIDITTNGKMSQSFVASNNCSLFAHNGDVLLMGLDRQLIKILEDQEYEKLLSFREEPLTSSLSPSVEFVARINDDGTTLIGMPASYLRS